VFTYPALQKYNQRMKIHTPDRLFLKFIQYIGWKVRFNNIIHNRSHQFQNLVVKLYISYTSVTLFILHKLFPSRYTDANPFKIIHVEPERIQFKTRSTFRHRGWVMDGDWDYDRTTIVGSELYACLKRRFVDNQTWEESGYIDFAHDEILRGGNAWNLDTKNQIEDRCNQLDSIWYSMKYNGYKSQLELIQIDAQNTYNQNIDALHPELNEIGIDIGRNGEILWNRVGQHRLIMAKLLDVETIPVLVYRRHRQWQQTRSKVRRTTDSHDSKHPDLAEFTDRR